MKVLTTAGLTKLIELSKGTFLDKNNVIDVSNALATVALTGSYTDLSNQPTIASLTTTAQLAAINSGANTTNIGQIATNTSAINTINDKIPSAATSSNQLADKAFVNSTVQTNAANFRGNWATWTAVPTSANDYPADYTGSHTPTVNDYMVIQDANDYPATGYYCWKNTYDSTYYTLSPTPTTDDDLYVKVDGQFIIPDIPTLDGVAADYSYIQTSEASPTRAICNRYSAGDEGTSLDGTWRFKYSGAWSTSGKSGWLPEYQVNETPMTQAQLDAINSGITSTKVNNYDTHIADTTIHVTTSDKSTWSGKQDALVSGTNIKTVNNNSLLGSGNITIDSLPTQTGQSGKFLTTNGTAASWATVDALPSQTGQSGKYLTTNGTSASWADVDALPSQSGNSGKYLTTNGTTPSWVSLTIPTTTNSITSGSTAALTSGGAFTNVVTAVEAGTTNNKINVTKAGSTSTITINNVANATTASKLGSTTVGGVTQPIYLDSGTPTALSYTIEKSVPSDAVFTDHTYTNGVGLNLTNGTTFSAKCDTTTVSTNGSSQLQALGVIDKKTSAAVYTWTGTKAQYDALGTYHNDWIYYITDDGTLTGDYYTKSQVDAMLYSTNHTITKDTPYIKLIDTNTNANTTTAPSEAHNGGLIQFIDSTRSHASGYVYSRYETNGDVKQILQVNKNVNNSDVSTYLAVGVKADGTKFTYAPTPAASTSTSDTNIATVGWINDPTKSTGLVHITGAETITGAKTFSANNTFNGTDTFTGNTRFTGNPVFISDNNTDALTIKNDDDIYSVLPVETLSTNIALHDKNGEVIGGLEHYHQTDGTSISQITARQHGGSNYGTIRVGIDISGNTWCNLPTDTYGTNFHGTSTRSMWADLAENYESDKEYPVGTLIRFGGEKDITVATINCNGVISDKPGYVLDSDLKNGQPVALVGKTPIRVLGKVNKFDRIVLDPEHPGLGKVQTTSDEKVIAIALKANSDVNEKLVMCVTKFNLD